MNKHEKYTNQKGFTIVELVIVIFVIGILASLVIVAYTGIQERAVVAVLKSDLGMALRELKSQNSLGNPYPTTAAEANGGKGFSTSAGTTMTYVAISGGYCLSSTATASGTTYHISSTNDWTIGEGECPGGVVSAPVFVAGGHHTCALKAGTVYCLGSNLYGQLGDNTLEDKSAVVAVNTSGALAGKTVTAISTGVYHTCALADGSAYCWGLNTSGQLGDGTTTQSSVPVAVSVAGVLAGKTVTAIDAGQAHTCAIADGLGYCWGADLAGQLGNNMSTTSIPAPVAVYTDGALSGKTLVAIEVGGDSASYRSCALSADAIAYCWGANGTYGALGNNSTAQSYAPVAVYTGGALAGKTVTSISVGFEKNNCLVASGQAFCWGWNSYGQIGNGTSSASLVPVAVNTDGVLAGRTVTRVAAGGRHACAIADGASYCWGRSNSGQIGYGSSLSSTVPVATSTAGVLAGKVLTDITTSNNHNCVMAGDESFCWGYNANGQLGDGTTFNSSLPIVAPALP